MKLIPKSPTQSLQKTHHPSIIICVYDWQIDAYNKTSIKQDATHHCTFNQRTKRLCITFKTFIERISENKTRHHFQLCSMQKHEKYDNFKYAPATRCGILFFKSSIKPNVTRKKHKKINPRSFLYRTRHEHSTHNDRKETKIAPSSQLSRDQLTQCRPKTNREQDCNQSPRTSVGVYKLRLQNSHTAKRTTLHS